MRKIALLCGALLLLTTACYRPNRPGRTTTTRPTGAPADLPAGTGDCDRACLTGMIDQYLQAIVAHDPSGLPLAPTVKFTEDNTVKRIGDGIWKTATGLSTYRQDLIDVRAGVAGTHVVLLDSGKPSLFLLRLRLVNRQITEVEQFAVHTAAEGSGIMNANALKTASPEMVKVPPAGQLEPRAEAIRLAEFYPRGLQAGSFVTVNAPFASDAYRFENGTRMAGPGCVMVTIGCTNIKTETIPRLSGLTYRLTGVDEEMGVTWLAMNFMPTGAGKSFFVWEMFKVYGGQIHAVEAFMKVMPTGPVW